MGGWAFLRVSLYNPAGLESIDGQIVKAMTIIKKQKNGYSYNIIMITKSIWIELAQLSENYCDSNTWPSSTTTLNQFVQADLVQVNPFGHSFESDLENQNGKMPI